MSYMPEDFMPCMLNRQHALHDICVPGRAQVLVHVLCCPCDATNEDMSMPTTTNIAGRAHTAPCSPATHVSPSLHAAGR